MLHRFLMAKKTAVLFTTLVLVCSGYLFSQEQKGGSSDEIVIKARYKEYTEDRILASGDVEIRYRNVALFADRIEFNQSTKEVLAEGNVAVHMPDSVVSARWIRFNLETLKGKMQDVYGRVKPTLSFKAESFQKAGSDLFSFQKAKVTTCTQPVPRWSFSCSKGNIRKDKYVEMWNPVFSVKNFPVFYLPYIRYPLHQERTTGFLTPQIGNSDQKGFFISQSFYWAIKRNMDATFNLDFYSSKGVGAGLEFRYLLSKDTGGQLNAYYFTFLKKQNQITPPPDYLLRFNHKQFLPWNFSMVVDVDIQSSYEFLKEFDNNFKRAMVWNRRTQVYITKSWSSLNFNMRASRFETYFSSKDQSTVVYNLPQINFNSFKIKLFPPLYFSFNSSFRRWKHSSLDGTESHSQNIAISPVLTLPLTKIPWFFINTSLTSNLIYSFQQYDTDTQSIVDKPYLRHNYVLNVELVGPTLYRIFHKLDEGTKLKHLIEPSVVYTYESPFSNVERIIGHQPLFRVHQVTYGLTNRVLIKKEDTPREVLSFSLEQSYYLSPETSPLRNYMVNGDIPEFSDVRGTLRFYPAKKYSLDVAAAFNPYYRKISGIRLGAVFGAQEDDWFLRVNWFKSVNPFTTDKILNRHQIQIFAGAGIPQLSINAKAEMSYNIQEGKMLYSGLRFIFHYQCIDFRGDVRVFYFREKPELQFRFSIGLGDIGKSIDMLGGMGF